MNEEVGIILQARDMASAAISKVRGELTGLGTVAQKVNTHLGGQAGLVKGLEGAWTHFRGTMGTIIGVAGFGGIAAGIAGVTNFLKESIDASQQFGLTAGRLSGILGVTHESAQLLTGVLEHYGLVGADATRVIGLLEKNLGRLTQTSDGAAKVEQQFGFSLLDSSGHVKDATTLLTDLSAYWTNTGIPVQQRVLLMQELFGRSWQDLLPLLGAGKAALQGVASEVTDYGLTSQDFVKTAVAQKIAMANFNSSLDALKVTIGADFVPIITEATRALTQFLSDPANRQKIVVFFTNLKDAVLNAITVIRTQVLPTLKSIVDGASTMWNSLPGPVKDLLVAGFTGERTIKFLFGVDFLGMGEKAIGTAIGNALGSLGSKIFGTIFGVRGATPATPMFVQDVLAEQSEAAIAAEDAGGLGRLGTAAGIAGVVTSVAAILGIAIGGGSNPVPGVGGGDVPLPPGTPPNPNSGPGGAFNMSPTDFKSAYHDAMFGGGTTVPVTVVNLPPVTPGTYTSPIPGYQSIAPGYTDYGLRPGSQMPTAPQAPDLTGIPGLGGENDVGAGWGDAAGAITDAADKIKQALSGLAGAFQGTTGSAKSAWSDLKKAVTGKQDSVPDRIKELQGEFDKLQKYMAGVTPKGWLPFKDLGPNSVAAVMTAFSQISDELGKEKTFMANRADIFGNVLPQAVAGYQGDWQQTWSDLGITVSDGLGGLVPIATQAGTTAAQAWAKAYSNKNNYAFAFAPAQGYVYTGGKGGGAAPGAGAGGGPAPAPGPSGGGAAPWGPADMARALHSDFDAIRQAVAAVQTWLAGSDMARVGDDFDALEQYDQNNTASINSAISTAAGNIVGRLNALIAKVQPIYVTVKPQPVYVTLNGRVIAQQLTAEQSSRYPGYTNPSGPRVD